MSREEDLFDALYEARELVRKGDYVVFDTETTGLRGQIIEWGICSPTGDILSQGRCKPTILIEPGAQAVHGISDEELADCPTFDQIALELFSHMQDKTIVGYNVSFDTSRFFTSISPYLARYTPDEYQLLVQQKADEENARNGTNLPAWRVNSYAVPFYKPSPYDPIIERFGGYHLDEKTHFCVMENFAAVYGELHEYYRTYTWQQLQWACSYYKIQQKDAHSAADDARCTALVLLKMAEQAEKELPEGYHPARVEGCAGGCGKLSNYRYRYDEPHIWYCNECGLKAGINQLCPQCELEGKRTIVSHFSLTEVKLVAPGAMCYQCEYKMNMANGSWHRCPRCSRTAKATAEKQLYCDTCIQQIEQEKVEKRAYQKEYRERKRKAEKREWTIREWHHYGKMDSCVKKVRNITAITREEARKLYIEQEGEPKGKLTIF